METNEVTPKPSVMSVGLKFGIIYGLISIIVTVVQIVAGMNPYENSWTSNIINLVLSVAIIVFAHKNFKESGNGYMSFGQGLGIAMIAVMVSIVLGGIFSFIYLKFIDPSIYEGIWEKAAADMEAQGQSEEAIEMGLGWGKKLFPVFFILGGLFWGLILGLIVTIFTQKKEPETAF